MRFSAIVRGVMVAAAIGLATAARAEAMSGTAPGSPGARALWTAGDKDGIGTSTTLGSKVWYTLNGGELTEVYYPDLGTPAVRDLQFVVTDGKSWVEREREDTGHVLRLTDSRSLSYQQVNTDPQGRFRITKTYTTDPSRSVLLMRVHFESQSRQPLHLYVLYDPSLSGNGDDDSGSTVGSALVASDANAASALVSSPAFTRMSSGFLGSSDGWSDLSAHHAMDWSYTSAPNGNVVQTARMELTGRRGSQDATLALGFGASASSALGAAHASLAHGFHAADTAYRVGWHDYLAGHPRPRSVAGHEELYDVSRMVIGASEDKTYRGAFIASPTMAWVWGQLAGYNGPYHLVWSRDLYQMATAEIAAGYRGAAERALNYLWTRQQEPDGCLPQNSHVDGSPEWTGLQLDEVADPILLASQLGHTDAAPGATCSVPSAASWPTGRSLRSDGRTQIGYSPSSIAAEIAGLVCAAQIAQANGDEWRCRPVSRHRGCLALATRPLDRHHQRTAVSPTPTSCASPWTATPMPVRPTPCRTAARRSTSAPSWTPASSNWSGSACCAPTTPPSSRRCRSWIASSASTLPNGQFWHRYNHDGYGKSLDRRPVRKQRRRGTPVADLRRRARRIRARGRPALRSRRRGESGGDDPPERDRQYRQRRTHASRAGLGQQPAVGHRRPGPGVRDRLSHAAGMDPRPVHPARLVDRRRTPGGAPGPGELPL